MDLGKQHTHTAGAVVAVVVLAPPTRANFCVQLKGIAKLFAQSVWHLAASVCQWAHTKFLIFVYFFGAALGVAMLHCVITSVE